MHHLPPAFIIILVGAFITVLYIGAEHIVQKTSRQDDQQQEEP